LSSHHRFYIPSITNFVNDRPLQLTLTMGSTRYNATVDARIESGATVDVAVVNGADVVDTEARVEAVAVAVSVAACQCEDLAELKSHRGAQRAKG
jgi:hypothetical protein